MSYRRNLYKKVATIGVLVLLVACKTDSANSNTGRSTAINSVQSCQTSAQDFAVSVCGEFDRRVRSVRYNIAKDRKTFEIEARAAIDSAPVSGNISYEYKAYYNVLREHLAGDLKDTRACRASIAELAYKDCRQEHCYQQCESIKINDIEALAVSNKKEVNCLRGKKSYCQVTCRQGTGSSKLQECKRECQVTNHPYWKQECSASSRGSFLSSPDDIERAFNSCKRQCK